MNTDELIKAADRCVLCALCSSHCPTYQLHHEEGESPRGRVTMSAALLRGSLKPEPAVITHLNHCLQCRACEKACPSEVPYGAIIDAALAQLPAPTGRAALLMQLTKHPIIVRLLARAAYWWNKARLPAPAIARAATTLLPPVHHPLHSHYPATTHPIGRVGLFLGCIAGPFDQRTHESAITLLTRLGYEVLIPQQQQCCGALAQHHGQPQQAAAHAEHNRKIFGSLQLDAVLFSTTGCGAQLLEQHSATPPYREICEFIHQSPGLDRVEFSPLPQQASLHHPCSLRNVLQGTTAVEQLLQQIPNLEWHELGPTGGCCGAAGSHQIREPKTAAALRGPKLDELKKSPTTLLLTTNYGCALHFAEGLIQQQQRVEVLHPVTLLARQLSPH